MAIPLNVLIVEDRESDADLMLLRLRQEGYAPDSLRVEHEEPYRKALLERKPDLVLSDWSLPQFSGQRALDIYNELNPACPFIIVSGSIGEEAAVSVMQQGAWDYIIKDRTERLGQAVKHALEECRLEIEKHKADERIRTSEERFRALFDSTGVGTYIMDIEGHILESNAHGAELLGYTSEEMLQLATRDITFPEDWQTIRDLSLDLLKGKRQAVNIEMPCRHKDGSSICTALSIIPIHDAAGQVSGFMTTSTDVSARKAAEDALRASEERYRNVSELISDYAYAFTVDQDNNLTLDWMVGGFERITGFTHEETEARGGWASLIHPEDMPLAEARTRKLFAGEQDVTEFRILRKDGSIRWLRDHGHPVWDDEQKRVTRIFGAVMDITERVLAQKELQENHRRLEEAQRIAHIGSWEWNNQDGSTIWSDEAFRIFGLQPGEKEPSYELVRERVHPEDVKLWEESLSESLKSGDRHQVSYRILRADDGKLSWVQDEAFVQRDEKGKALMLVGTIQDITEREAAEQKIRASEAQYRLIVTHANEGIWQVDTLNQVSFLNQRMAEMLGCSVEEVLGRNADDFAFPEDLPEMEARMPARKQGISEVYQRRLRRVDGGQVWVLTSASPLMDEQGEYKGCMSLNTDITEQVRTQSELQVSHRRLEEAQRIAHLGSWERDLRSGDAIWSDEVFRINGLQPGEKVPSYDLLRSHMHPEDVAVWERALNESLESRERYSVEYRIKRVDDGQEAWLHDEALVIRDEAGKAVRLVGTVQDITERVAAEQKIRASEEQYRLIVTHANEGIWQVDENDSFTYLNQQMADILGCSVEQAIRTEPDAFVFQEDLEETRARRAKSRDGKSQSYEHRLRRFDGSEVWVLTNASPLADPDGAYQGCLGLTTDISERKLAEQKLARSHHRLEEAQRIARLGNWEWDLQTGEVFWSDELYRIAGMEPDDKALDPDKVWALNHPDDRDAYNRRLQEAMLGGERFQMESRMLRADNGQVVWVHDEADILRDPEGNALKLVGTTQDITERKLAEERLRESEERYRMISTVASDYMYSNRLDADGKLTFNWVAGAFESITGYTQEEYTAHGGWRGSVHPDDLEIDDRDMVKLHANQPVTTEIRTLTKSGEVVWVRAYVQPVWDAERDELKGVFGAVQDITERKLAEQKLAQTLRSLEEAQRIARIGSWEVDLESMHSTWSDEMYRICGLEPGGGALPLEQVRGLNHPDDHEQYERTMNEAIQNHERFRIETRIIRADNGQVVWVQEDADIQIDDTGRAVKMAGTSQDITERKLTEQALAESHRQLVDAQRIARIGSWVTDIETMQVTWSEEMYNITGLPKGAGKLTHEMAISVNHPEDAERYNAAIAETVRTGGKLSIECRIIHASNGQVVWVHDEADPVCDPQGRVVKLVGTTQDITNRKLAEQQIADTLHTLKEAQRIGHIGSWELDVESGRLTWSDEMYSIAGLPQGKVPITLELAESIKHPDDIALYNTTLEECIRSGRKFSLESRCVRPDNGQVVWMQDEADIIHDSTGKPVRVVGITQDITERKLAEQALRESEEKYRAIFENAVLGIYQSTPGGAYLDVNPAYVRIYGYDSPQQMIDEVTDISSMLYQDPAMRLQLLEIMEKEGQVREFEIQNKRRDGQLIWIAVNALSIRDESGQVAYYSGTVADITARKEAEEALRESEEKYRAIFENAVLGIYQSTPGGSYLDVNPAFARIYGFESPQQMVAEVTDIAAALYMDPADRRRFSEIMEKDGFVREFEMQNKRRDGKPICVSVNSIAIRDNSGQVAYYNGTVSDITTRKLAEEARRRNEILLEKVFNILPVGLWIADENGVLQRGNPAGVRIWGGEPGVDPDGYSVFKARRLPSREEIAPEDWALAHTIREGATISDELLEIDALDGVKRTILNYTAPLIDDEGELMGAIVVNNDISERVRAENVQHAFFEVAQLANDAQDLPALYSGVHAVLGGLMRADNLYIALYDTARGVLHFPYYKDEVDKDEGMDAPLSRGLTEYVLRTGESLLLDLDLEKELTDRGEIEMVDTPSPIWLGVPLKVGSETIGVIVVQDYHDPHAYGAREQQILEYISQQVSTAIQRQLSVQALRESEEKYHAIFENAVLGIYQATPQGSYLDVNPAYARIYGYESPQQILEEVTDISRAIYTDPAIRKLVLKKMENDGFVRDFEVHHKRRDGQDIWVSVNAVPVRGEDGTVLYYNGSVADITERIQAEQDQRQSQERYRLLVESLPDALYINRGGVIVYVNPAALDLYGASRPEELIGRDPYTLVHPDFHDMIRERFRILLEDRQPVPLVEQKIVRLDGGVRDVEVASAPYEDFEGQAFQVVLRDISERKQAEARLRDKIAELLIFQRLTVGREMKMIDLKKEVNDLLVGAGQPPRYRIRES